MIFLLVWQTRFKPIRWGVEPDMQRDDIPYYAMNTHFIIEPSEFEII